MGEYAMMRIAALSISLLQPCTASLRPHFHNPFVKLCPPYLCPLWSWLCGAVGRGPQEGVVVAAAAAAAPPPPGRGKERETVRASGPSWAPPLRPARRPPCSPPPPPRLRPPVWRWRWHNPAGAAEHRTVSTLPVHGPDAHVWVSTPAQHTQGRRRYLERVVGAELAPLGHHQGHHLRHGDLGVLSGDERPERKRLCFLISVLKRCI